MLELNFNPFPEICTQRLLLRRIEEADYPAVYAIRSNPEIMQKLDKHPVKNMDELMPFINAINNGINSNNGITWAICFKEDNIHIGNISFHNIYKEHHRAEVGYAILPSYHRKGIVNEALEAILEFGFKKLNFHSVEAKVNPINNASISLLTKHGFVKEAHFKQDYYFNGVFSDTGVYSLLNKYNN